MATVESVTLVEVWMGGTDGGWRALNPGQYPLGIQDALTESKNKPGTEVAYTDGARNRYRVSTSFPFDAPEPVESTKLRAAPRSDDPPTHDLTGQPYGSDPEAEQAKRIAANAVTSATLVPDSPAHKPPLPVREVFNRAESGPVPPGGLDMGPDVAESPASAFGRVTIDKIPANVSVAIKSRLTGEFAALAEGSSVPVVVYNSALYHANHEVTQATEIQAANELYRVVFVAPDREQIRKDWENFNKGAGRMPLGSIGTLVTSFPSDRQSARVTLAAAVAPAFVRAAQTEVSEESEGYQTQWIAAKSVALADAILAELDATEPKPVPPVTVE